MGGIFISYRREDTKAYARLLSDALVDVFGPRQVFRDIDTMGPGVDFLAAIRDAVGKCDVLLALIGNQWLTATQQGRRRLDNPDDYVRVEIATALRRNVLVVPILIEDARIPDRADLPEPLAELVARNAQRLTDENWNDGVQRLMKALAEVVPPVPSPSHISMMSGPAAAFAPPPSYAGPAPTSSEAPPGRGTKKGARRRTASVLGLILLASIVVVKLAGSNGPDPQPFEPQQSDSSAPVAQTFLGTVAMPPGLAAKTFDGPSLDSYVLGRLETGAHVAIECTVQGDAVKGTGGTSTLWDRLTDGSYIPDSNVDTQTNQPVMPQCP